MSRASRMVAAPVAPSGPRSPSPRLRALLTPLLVGSVVSAPLLVPRTPGNSVPGDLVNALFVVVGAAIFWRSRARLRLPLGLTYFLALTGGILATSQSISPEASALTIAQDTYLFAWFVMVANFIGSDDGRTARLVTVTWVVVAVAEGALMSATMLMDPTDAPALFGYPVVNIYGRALGTFRDPNMAGNYLAVSLFVLWTSPRPRSRTLKLLLAAPIVAGVYATQSITALVTVAGGAAVALVFRYVSSRRAAVAAVLLVLGTAAALAPFLPEDFGRRSDRLLDRIGSTERFAGSIGRSDRSLSLRVQRWEEALTLFGSEILLGIGPATTDEALEARDAPIVGEIHNDYIAGFLERGLIGGIGVVGIFVMVVVFALHVGASRAVVRMGVRPWPLLGSAVVVLMAAISLETLHFRHVWLLFALIAGLHLAVEPAKAASAERPAAPVPGRPRVVVPTHAPRA